ncbi:MAG: EAL domain-containing protein [Micavibrio aeruginosavorus]|uniref:EAL domain-containing protein n=1 Tax=Micavibrio aeruginosavorus TaxID=349221 RepID=A0A7T5UG62_9BACT|nr:MAG: EAL domain-containing protein [Micavibrio aeruginosavorus]
MLPEFLTTPEDKPENNPDVLFRFARFGRTDEFSRLRRRLFVGSVAAAVCGTALLYAIGQYATPDFLILVAALILLGGLVIYDIFSRRLWENAVSVQIQTLIRNHDRLVREVARNRTEISVLKEGLFDTAHAVEEEGRHQSPSSSIEAKMIGTIVSRLAALGRKAIPGEPLPPEQPPPRKDTAVMALQIAPPAPKAPPMSELDMAMDPKFTHYSDAMIQGLLEQAVQEDRVDVFVQPVVSLPQRKPRMYEVFGRIRAMQGTYLPATHYMAMAQKEQLMPAIENLLLLRCLQILRDSHDRDSQTPYILNISTETLNDTGFMGDLVTFLSQNRAMANRLIFELPQAQIDSMPAQQSSILDGLSRLGVRFSMDRVSSGKFDVPLLKSRHIRFIKLDAAWLTRENASDGGHTRISRLKTQLDGAGIDLIMEKVENEKTLRELLDFGIDYGQGWHFGKPDLYGARKTSRKVA